MITCITLCHTELEPTQPAQPKEVNLITFFDCSAEDNLTTLEEVERCDLFAYVGAQVARDRLNADPHVPVNVTLHQVKIDSSNSHEVGGDKRAKYIGLYVCN